MRTRLTGFAAEFMAEAEAEQRLKEVFEKCMDIARISKGAGNYEQLNPISTPVPLQHFWS